MKHYEYIFFDMDGTVSESAPGIIDSIIYALNLLGIEETDREKLKDFVGPPLLESFPKYYGIEGEQLMETVRNFQVYFREKGIWGNEMYPDIPQVLKSLKENGRRIVLATSKPELFAKEIIDRYKIGEYFDFVAGSVMDETRTLKHEVIEYAIENMGISDRSSILMVGDRRFDVEGADKCGIDCMGVLYGYGTREELESAGAAYIAETVLDIARIILSDCQG